MGEVARSLTPVTREELARLICERLAAYVGVGGVDLNVATGVYSLVWSETSGQSVIQHNFGNIIALSESEPYWVPPWVNDPTHRLYGVPGIPTKFRAYGSAAEGMDALLSLLDHRYSAAIQAATVADWRGFSRELLAAGYCPDCAEEQHANTIESVANQIQSLMVFQQVCGDDFEIITGADVVTDPNAAAGTLYRAILGPSNGYLAAGALVLGPASLIGYLRAAKRPRVKTALGVLAAYNLALVGSSIAYRRKST